mgnify:CR=1 FL=1
MIRTPEWQAPLYRASIGVATLLDEIDDHQGFDEDDEVYRHAAALQLPVSYTHLTLPTNREV